MTRWGSCRGGGLRQRGRAAAAALVLAYVMLFPPLALAQTRSVVTATSTAQAAILEPASLLKVQDMNFGRIAARSVAGTVVLNPATDACTTTNGLVHVGVCLPARFAGRGRRNLIARFTFPTSVNLTRVGGGTMVLNNFTFDASGDLQLQINGNGNGAGNIRYLIVSTSGQFTLEMGGTLNVGANQQPGTYTGTFNVSVQYL